MTLSAPHCSCDDSWFPSLGRPCPIHGSKWNRHEMDALRKENATLRADAADYAAMAEAELSALRATCEQYREVIEREQIAGLFNQILKPRGSGIDGGTAA